MLETKSSLAHLFLIYIQILTRILGTLKRCNLQIPSHITIEQTPLFHIQALQYSFKKKLSTFQKQAQPHMGLLGGLHWLNNVEFASASQAVGLHRSRTRTFPIYVKGHYAEINYIFVRYFLYEYRRPFPWNVGGGSRANIERGISRLYRARRPAHAYRVRPSTLPVWRSIFHLPR